MVVVTEATAGTGEILAEVRESYHPVYYITRPSPAFQYSLTPAAI